MATVYFKEMDDQKCPFCFKIFSRKDSCQRHQKICKLRGSQPPPEKRPRLETHSQPQVIAADIVDKFVLVDDNCITTETYSTYSTEVGYNRLHGQILEIQL